MSKNLRNGLLLSVVLAGVSASQASAQTVPTVPAECNNSRDSKGFTAGRTAGESRVNSIWKSAAVNQNLDNLSAQLDSSLASLQTALVGLSAGGQPTQYVQCRAQGYAEGFLYRLNKLFGQCVLDGADWGQFAADVYCSLSLELDGLAEESLFVRAPVGLCGNLFEFTCEDTYHYVASEGADGVSSVVQTYLDQQSIVLTPFQGCAAYTTDEFLPAFEAAVHNDCTYEIAP
jgi:hypothetical protein